MENGQTEQEATVSHLRRRLTQLRNKAETAAAAAINTCYLIAPLSSF